MAFSLFEEMKRFQLQPNWVTYNTLLRARSRYGSLYEVQRCLAVYQDMRKAGYLEFLQDLEKKIDDDWDKISILLEEIRKSLLSRKGFTINMTSDEENLAAAMKYLSKFVDSLPTTFPGNNSWETILSPRNEAIVIPTQVNYVGKVANIYESGYQLHGSVHVISKYVNTTWLWDRLRTSGGAYGGGCNFDALSGVLSYSSFRDPNLLKTLDVYDGTASFLRELELDDDSLTKSIIDTMRGLEGYQLPDAKGYRSLVRYLTGVTEEYRVKRHEEVLSTTLGGSNQCLLLRWQITCLSAFT